MGFAGLYKVVHVENFICILGISGKTTLTLSIGGGKSGGGCKFNFILGRVTFGEGLFLRRTGSGFTCSCDRKKYSGDLSSRLHLLILIIVVSTLPVKDIQIRWQLFLPIYFK